MKKHLLFIVNLFLFSLPTLRAGDHPPASLSGTYLVGNSQATYKKLKDVALALNNAANTITGNVIFELDSDYDGTTGETFPITFNQFNTSGNWTVTIRPKAGVTMRTTTGTVSTTGKPLIILDGADRLILDGRPGGMGDTTGWIIRNKTVATSDSPTMQLLNDAQNNIFTYLQLEGQSTNTATGIVTLGTTTGSQGNDNNTISYCTIRDRSDITTTTPGLGIYSRGAATPATAFNSGTVITHNNFVNIYKPALFSAGISLDQGTTDATVTHNSFYQTRSILNTTISNAIVYAIAVNEPAASNIDISNNYIGGSAPECGGTAYKLTNTGSSANARLSGIAFINANATGSGNVISGNRIRNIEVALDRSTSSDYNPFCAIEVVGGRTDVTNNMIGNSDGYDDIKITMSNAATATVNPTIISFKAKQGGRITGNKIGGITFVGSLVPDQSNYFYGIYVSFTPNNGSVTMDVNDNLVGSTTLTDNIRATGTGIPVSFFGISLNLPIKMSCKNNTVSGISLGYKGTTVNTLSSGIDIAGTGDAVIDHNTIADFSSASLRAYNTFSFVGLRCAMDSAVVSNNTIRGLRLTGTEPMAGTPTQFSNIFGMVINSMMNHTAEIYNNKLYDFTSANDCGPNSATVITGIEIRTPAVVYNNLISLTNGENTNNCEIKGIQAGSGTANIYHNTVYIGGNNGAPSNTATSKVISRTATQAILEVRNNLLVNGRTGGSGPYYIFHNAVATPATNWAIDAADYNVLVAPNRNTIGRWGSSDMDSAQWKTVSDTNSSVYILADPAGLFTDLSSLEITTSSRGYVAGEGGPGTAITTDLIGDPRSLNTPSAGAYEYPSAILTGLEISEGELSPVFHPKRKLYTDVVLSNNITVRPVSGDPDAEITVNGIPVMSGMASDGISLNPGPNTVTVVSTAPDHTHSRTYTVTVMLQGSQPEPVDTTLSALELSNGILSPSFSSDQTDYTASVNNAVGSLTVMARASQVGSTITVNGIPVVSGNASGDITLNVGMNTITIVVTGTDGTTTQTYTIAVFREAAPPAPNAAPTDLALSETTITENAAAGSTVGTLMATDPDPGSSFTYTLATGEGSADNAAFTIEADQLKINSSPDHETKSSYQVRIRVTDAGSLYFEKAFIITVIDVNENTPVITSHGGNAAVTLPVPENTTAVTTVTATDADAADVLTYSLAPEEDAGSFSINPSTGELRFITAPDFEMPGDANGDNTYIVTVKVSDGEATASQRFKLKITDANDHAPVLTSYNGELSVTLRMEENTTAVGTVKAIDADRGAVITYSLVNEEDAGRFSVNNATGELKFMENPDFDQPADTNGDNTYIVLVKASDGDSSVIQRFKIKITDLNDNPPVFTSHNGNAVVELELPENTQLVTTVAATDGDHTAVTYTILDEKDGALFSLDASGQLGFIAAPDFEHPADMNHDNIYVVSVKASDGSLSAVQRFMIKITDINDNLPMVTMTVRMPENMVVVTGLEATDADAGSSFTMSILDEEDGALFRINAASGTLEFATAPDFEQPADADHDNTYFVLIKITDGGFSFILRLKIKVTNVDEAMARSSTAKGPEVTAEQKAVTLQTGTETGKGIRVYPNPVTGKRFTLQMDSVAAGRYLLGLYTTTGQLAYTQQLDHTGKPIAYPIQLPAGITPGVYVLRLLGAKTRFSEKIMID